MAGKDHRVYIEKERERDREKKREGKRERERERGRDRENCAIQRQPSRKVSVRIRP